MLTLLIERKILPTEVKFLAVGLSSVDIFFTWNSLLIGLYLRLKVE